MSTYKWIDVPKDGTKIGFQNGRYVIPDNPILPFIEGDGIGVDIWPASRMVFDAAVARAYGGKRRVVWMEVPAGEKAYQRTGEWLPEETVHALNDFSVGMKGPLTTPVGGGIRSLNVTLRQVLDLYACVRPVRYIAGVPAPVKHPEQMNVVIFRENTEDVYAGIEWKEGSDEARQVIEFLNKTMGKKIRPDSGIGIKPISRTGSQNLIRKAIQYALARGHRRVTLVHKGNIMKFTEGAFRDWGYELASREFPDRTVTEDIVWEKHGGKIPEGKVMINDRIADSMFQQIVLRPDEYEIIAAPNLNGDYLSDACAAQIGGLGMAPGANMSDRVAVFEATHGTAPKYAGQDKVNPCSVILSGVMMFEHIGWNEVGNVIYRAVEKTIAQKRVTYDLERQMQGATVLKTSEFGKAVCENMG